MTAASDPDKALVLVDNKSKACVLSSSEFKVPKLKKKKVLEEDDYEDVSTLCIAFWVLNL